MRLASKSYVSFVLSLLFAIAVTLAPGAASAQSWRVDSEHSIARLSLGAGAQSVEAGLARVGGSVSFNPADPAGARFNLTILDEDPQAAEHSEITFQSKQSWINPDGSLAVKGDLTVTRIARSVQVHGNEGYHGAEYGEPVAYSNTSEVTLVVSKAKPGGQDRVVRLSASARVNEEDSPLLRAALEAGDWPSVVVRDRQQPALAPTLGEGYAGVTSTGTPVVTATNNLPAGSGEGYYGFEPAVEPAAGRATLALDLELTPTVASGSGAGLWSGN